MNPKTPPPPSLNPPHHATNTPHHASKPPHKRVTGAHIHLTVTVDQANHVRAQADKAGVSMNGYIRNMINAEMGR